MIINENNVKSKQRKSMLNLYGQIDGNLGIVKMNKEHRYNTLTSNLIENIDRGVETMDIDHIVTTIYLQSENSEHFSNGTDFRTIAHMKKEDNYGRIQEYLTQLYQLQTKVASINKPLIAVANGHALNSGAALLAAAGHPMVTLDSKIAFNEVTFGFVPHSGATYYLSRMPGEFGTFMALTGLPIHGSDAARIQLANGVVHQPKNYEQEVADVLRSKEFPPFSGKDIYSKQKGQEFMTPWQSYLMDKQAMIDQMGVNDVATMFSEKLIQNEHGDFIELKNRTPSSVAEAEFKYKELLKKDARDRQSEVGYFDFHSDSPTRGDQFMYQNYYNETMGYLKLHINQNFPHDSGFAVNHKQLIDRCFLGNSVEQIMENLRREQHPFATQCLKQMENNSMLSMNLALGMIRKAANLDYKSILEMELNVAFNKIQDKEFDTGVQSILLSPKPQGSQKKVANFSKKVVQSDLERYYEPSKWSGSIDLKIVENALLPTKHYYERFSDQVRLWLNESSTTQGYIREKFDQEAKEALQEHGIDVRDKALTPKIARSHLAAQLAKENVEKVLTERMEQMMVDTQLRERYFKEIEENLSILQTDQTHFYNQVNKHINTIFQDAFLERIDNISRKSRKVQSLEKRRMLVQFKKFLFKSRILSFGNEQIERSMKQFEALPFQQIHLTEKWDQSFRDGQHPNLVQTPLYHLSKVIGRVSLTTPELTKAYLTNSANRDQMKMFTLDKNELDRLQTDILQNPEKYEILLTGNIIEETDSRRGTKRLRDLGQAKLDEQEYWFRIINDGRCPLDDFPYAREFNAYKNWVSQIESQALDTLRMCVDKLILEAQDEKKEYSGKLQGLIKVANNTKDKQRPKRSEIAASKMGDKTRPLHEIKQSLREILKKDFGALFSEDENSKISKLRENFENELLSLVEIVLLDKYGYAGPNERKNFENRLAALSNPIFSSEQQLNYIDNFLSQKNGESLIRDAVNLALPFFNQQIQTLLKEEAQKVLGELKGPESQLQILFNYFFVKACPEAAKSKTLEKFYNYSLEEEADQYLSAAYPFLTPEFRKRDLLAVIGLNKTNQQLSIDERKQLSLSKTQQDIASIKKFDNNFQQRQFKKSSEEEKEKHLAFSEFEIRELEALEQKVMEVYETLHNNKYELDNHLNEIDYMNMYATSVLDNKIDMVALEKGGDEQTWTDLAHYARCISELSKQVQKAASTQNFDAITFLEQQDSQSKQHQNFYESIVAERNRVKTQANSINFYDRESLIRGDIDDFNRLQDSIKLESRNKAEIVKLVQTKSQTVKNQVNQFLDNPQFVNFEQLHHLLKNKEEDLLKNPSVVIDVPRLLKQHKDILSVSLDQSADVISLNQLQQQVQNDTTLDAQTKQNLNSVISYVDSQAKYMSNTDRKNLTIREYLQKNNFSSAQAYTNFASSLLKQQLGSLQEKVESEIIDWQVGQTRTHPSDHLQKVNVDKVLKMQDDDEEEDAIVYHKNQVTKQMEADTVRDYEYKKIMRLAKQSTELPLSMTPTKNLYENKLLKQLMAAELDETEVNKVVDAYTEIRLKTCLLNSTFANQMKTENAHIFLKVLREQVASELNLTKPAESTEMAHNTITDQINTAKHFDLESPYNLQNINNVDALGYDNLLERAKTSTAKQNFETAHETVFEKLLADYFLEKRGEYKESNKLLKDLSQIFEEQSGIQTDLSPMQKLNLTNLNQNIGKSQEASIPAENFREMIELDVAASRALQSNKNGLSDQLRQLSIDETDHEDYFKTQIPEYFDVYDARKPASKYVEDKLREVIQESFDVRAQLEKNMSRRELIAFDKVLAKYLQHNNLMPKLRRAVSKDYNQLHTSKTLIQADKDNHENAKAQAMKFGNEQRTFNKETQNEDALFKLLAFNAANENKNQALVEARDNETIFNQDSFSEWYKAELMSDAKRKPRQIDAQDFKAKKPWEYPQEAFKNTKQRQESFYKDHSVYLEKKKEQQERIQLFYVLEQFFETARQKPDPTSKAQQDIVNYFAEPENTFFFDKNKIF